MTSASGAPTFGSSGGDGGRALREQLSRRDHVRAASASAAGAGRTGPQEPAAILAGHDARQPNARPAPGARARPSACCRRRRGARDTRARPARTGAWRDRRARPDDRASCDRRRVPRAPGSPARPRGRRRPDRGARGAAGSGPGGRGPRPPARSRRSRRRRACADVCRRCHGSAGRRGRAAPTGRTARRRGLEVPTTAPAGSVASVDGATGHERVTRRRRAADRRRG